MAIQWGNWKKHGKEKMTNIHDEVFHTFTQLCDKCNTEFEYRSHYSSEYGCVRVIKELGDIRLTFTTGLHSWNSANLCEQCIIEILEDDIPSLDVQTTNSIKRTITYIAQEDWPMHVLADNITVGRNMWRHD